MPVNASPVPPPPVAAAGDDGLVAQPPAVTTAVEIVTRRNETAMVHAAHAVMAMMGKTRVANTVHREVMATDAKVPVPAMKVPVPAMKVPVAAMKVPAAATTMPMAAMPRVGRIMGAAKHQRGRHQNGCGEQLSLHRSSPWPVLPCGNLDATSATASREMSSLSTRPAAADDLPRRMRTGMGQGCVRRLAVREEGPRLRRDRRARQQDHPSRCRGDRSQRA